MRSPYYPEVCTKPGRVTPHLPDTDLSNTGLPENLICPTLCCESPSPSCMQYYLIYLTPGLSNTWSIQHLVYPTPGLSNTCFIQHLVYPTPGLSNTWFIQHLVYPTPGLSNTWSIQHLVYPTPGLSDIFYGNKCCRMNEGPLY